MAFDGIVIAGLVKEMKDKLIGGRILKIQQPEKDELIITIKNYDQYRLFISADASLPLIYIASSKKEAPLSAPNFCMLLRKYIGTARIVDIYQPDFERVIVFELEHLDEMGDVCRKKLIVEIMGKHSNIIFANEEEGKIRVIDSIKHVSAAISSVREVLPGRDYFIPKTIEKFDPMKISEEEFAMKILGFPGELSKAVYMSLTGFSPVMANELLFRARIPLDSYTAGMDKDMLHSVFEALELMITDIREGRFEPSVVYKEEAPVEFAALNLTLYEGHDGYEIERHESVSSVLESFYAKRNALGRMKQKSADLRKLVGNAIERTVKKFDIQKKQLDSTEKRDKYKLYGELLTTYGYGLEAGIKSADLENFYDGSTVTVPLDPDISPIENAKRYFERYSKLKRTYEAVSEQISQTEEEMAHLDSINVALGIASCDDDLDIIKQELVDCGYIKGHFGHLKTESSKGKNRKNAGSREKSRPLHYVTKDGFHIYVGKNNYQNDELTFKVANGGDWWFHAKKNAGSHVIVKTEGRELPDEVYVEAASLAAFYSKASAGSKVDVDYLQRKDVKKPNGSKPGFVVYYTNYSMTVVPGINGLTAVE